MGIPGGVERLDLHQDLDTHEVFPFIPRIVTSLPFPQYIHGACVACCGNPLALSRERNVHGEEPVEILQDEEHPPHSSAGTEASILLCRS